MNYCTSRANLYGEVRQKKMPAQNPRQNKRKPRKSKIQDVRVHNAPTEKFGAVQNELDLIHVQVIKRHLSELNANTEQKIEIIDKIIIAIQQK
jgi:hypothetical protein